MSRSLVQSMLKAPTARQAWCGLFTGSPKDSTIEATAPSYQHLNSEGVKTR